MTIFTLAMEHSLFLDLQYMLIIFQAAVKTTDAILVLGSNIQPLFDKSQVENREARLKFKNNMLKIIQKFPQYQKTHLIDPRQSPTA